MIPSLSPQLVLIVEDESDIRYTLQVFLESEGYSVLTAENGSDALALLKNARTPHVILLDMKMPVMNGWQFGSQSGKALTIIQLGTWRG